VISESRERTFDTDISDPSELREALARMAGDLCGNLATNRRAGRTIAIKVRLDDFTTDTRARTVSEPTRDVDLVTSVALGLLEDYSPPRPVVERTHDLIRLVLAMLPSRSAPHR